MSGKWCHTNRLGSDRNNMSESSQEKGHGAHFVCPISNLQGNLAAILFVDNTGIVHMDMCKDQSMEEAHYSLHKSIQNWRKLLMAKGGAFKPLTCFYYMISYIWKRDGK